MTAQQQSAVDKEWQGYDAVIVGGGVIGLSCAYELLRRQMRVLVLERGVPGAGATHAAAGMLAPTCEAELAEAPLVQLGFDSLRRYPSFIQELAANSGVDAQLRREGTLWLAFNHDDEGDLAHLRQILRSKDLAAEPVTPTQALELEPLLSPRVVAGLHVPGDVQIEPRALVQALLSAIARLGGRVAAGVEVRAIEQRGQRVSAVVAATPDGGVLRVEAPRVVLAAGAWSCATIESPLKPLGVRPVKGQIVRLRGAPLVRHVVRTPDGYLVPRHGGDLLLGATMEEKGFDATAQAGAVLDLLRKSFRAVPGIYELEFVECAVGFRPAVRDHMPVIGATSVEGLFVSTGHHRDGVLLAPASAHYLAEWMVTQRPPEALAPFSAARFCGEPSPAAAGAAVR